jgi:hypothetical protein
MQAGGAPIRCVRLPKALRRKPLAMLDGASRDGSALVRLLEALEERGASVVLPGARSGDSGGRVCGPTAAVLREFLRARDAGLKRVRAELRICDATLQERAGPPCGNMNGIRDVKSIAPRPPRNEALRGSHAPPHASRAPRRRRSSSAGSRPRSARRRRWGSCGTACPWSSCS